MTVFCHSVKHPFSLSTPNPPTPKKGGDMKNEHKNLQNLHDLAYRGYSHFVSYTFSLIVQLAVLSILLCVTPAIIVCYGAVGFLSLYGILVILELLTIWFREKPLRASIKKQLDKGIY